MAKVTLVPCSVNLTGKRDKVGHGEVTINNARIIVRSRYVFFALVPDCQFCLSHFGFWSANFFLILPFPDHCFFDTFLLSIVYCLRLFCTYFIRVKLLGGHFFLKTLIDRLFVYSFCSSTYFYFCCFPPGFWNGTLV